MDQSWSPSSICASRKRSEQPMQARSVQLPQADGSRAGAVKDLLSAIEK